MQKPKFLSFLWAAGKIGGSSVIFALILFGIAIWEHYKARNVPAELLVACGVMFFCVGAYLAWSKERTAFDHLKREMKDREPDLKLKIFGSVCIYSPDDNRHVWLMGIEVGNTGAATSIVSWGATYELNGGVEYMTSYHIPRGFTVPLLKDVRTFRQDDLIQTIMRNRRLERNEAIQGRVLFTVPGNREPQVKACAYRIRVTCTDLNGFTAIATYTPAAESTDSHFGFESEPLAISREEWEKHSKENVAQKSS
jgi:hypothetical protein